MKSLTLLILTLAGMASAHADVYCRFDPTGYPSSYLRVHTHTGTALSITGWPEKRTHYRDVVVQNIRGGFQIVVFGDVPILKALHTNNGHLWFDQNEVTYPFEAYWNPKLPGGPVREAIRGVCWTDRLQKVPRNTEGPFH